MKVISKMYREAMEILYACYRYTQRRNVHTEKKKIKNQKTVSFTSLATTQSIIILGLITITEKKAKGTLVKLNAIVTSKISFGK